MPQATVRANVRALPQATLRTNVDLISLGTELAECDALLSVCHEGDEEWLQHLLDQHRSLLAKINRISAGTIAELKVKVAAAELALKWDDEASSEGASAISPNGLDRQFTADHPNRKWIADFTYVWTADGWLYVAAVIDLFSRRVVGWSMKAEMSAQLVTDALLMAIWRRCCITPTAAASIRVSSSSGGSPTMASTVR